MRVSSQGAIDSLLARVLRASEQMARAQERVGNERRVNRPSDDPVSAGRIMAARSALERAQQFGRNISLAEGELAVTEAALGRLTAVLQRASELTVQAANGTLGASERNAIAIEVGMLLDESVTIGNTTYVGRYIFAGHLTDTAPYVPDTPVHPSAVTYVGDGGLRLREIGEGTRAAVNVTGDRVLPEIFTTLVELRDALEANDTAVLDVATSAVAARLDSVLALRGEIGGTTRRVEMARERLAGEEAATRELLMRMDGVDLVASIVELQVRETAYQAALSSVGRVLGLSLLDFLR